MLVRQVYLLIAFTLLHVAGFCQSLKVDHVIAVVVNIDEAIKSYTEKGFTVKKGADHKNGLTNAHIKFSNGSYLELMSIKGEPNDEIARTYVDLLDDGEGGVFIALSGITTAAFQRNLEKLNIEYETKIQQNWTYITFEPSSGIAHFFFIEYHNYISEAKPTPQHKNLATRIESVWVEGEIDVKYFLDGIGLESRKDALNTTGGRFITESGEIILVSNKNNHRHPRIRAISFLVFGSSETIRIEF